MVKDDLKDYEGKKVQILTAAFAIGGTISKLKDSGLVLSDEKGEAYVNYSGILGVKYHPEKKIETIDKKIITP